MDPTPPFRLRWASINNKRQMINDISTKKVILIDKPVNWTSFDVVAKVRSALSKQLSLLRKASGGQAVNRKQANGKEQIANSTRKRLRVGHSGTLDPFATGLLIILVGDATKKQAEFMKLDKEYEATLQLGYTSTTGDPEGTIMKMSNVKTQMPNEAQINKILRKFKGEQKQIPPKYSAIKIKGKKAYELARKGEDFELKPRTIILYGMEVLDYQFPELHLKIRCSSGTYIRTLAEDIGKALGTGAYLTALRRTKIGDFDIKDAKNINDVA